MKLRELQKLFNKLNFTTTLSEDGVLGRNTINAKSKFDVMFGNNNLTEGLVAEKQLKMLPVPYLTQRGRYKYSSRMCSVSCVLMLSAYFNSKNEKLIENDIISLDKEIDSSKSLKKWATSNKLDYYVKKQKLEQISSVMAHILTDKTDLKFSVGYKTESEIANMLDAQIPMIVSVRFPGRKTNNKRSGHYIVLTGHFSGNFTVNDPYGLWEDFYSTTQDIKTKGESITIPSKDLFGQWGCKTEKDDKTGDKSSVKYRVITISDEYCESAKK